MKPSSFGNSPLVMRLIEIFFMSFLLDSLAQTTINAFLGDRPHAAPGELQYIRYGTDADADARVHISVLPPKPVGSTRFVIVSDTHERHEKLVLPPGDVLIHCGDVLCCSKYLSTRSGVEKLHAFNDWLSTVPCPTKLVIGGNHDSVMETIGKTACQVRPPVFCMAVRTSINRSCHVSRRRCSLTPCTWKTSPRSWAS